MNLPPGVPTSPGSDYNYQPPPPQTPYPPPPQMTPYPQQQQYQPYAAAQATQKKTSMLPWILAVFVVPPALGQLLAHAALEIAEVRETREGRQDPEARPA